MSILSITRSRTSRVSLLAQPQHVTMINQNSPEVMDCGYTLALTDYLLLVVDVDVLNLIAPKSYVLISNNTLMSHSTEATCCAALVHTREAGFVMQKYSWRGCKLGRFHG